MPYQCESRTFKIEKNISAGCNNYTLKRAIVSFLFSLNIFEIRFFKNTEEKIK